MNFLRLLCLLLTLILGACSKPSVTVVFVVPDGYQGILKIRSQQPSGEDAKIVDGQCLLTFSKEGLCDLKGELPTLSWHKTIARHANGSPITSPAFPETAPEDAFGLWPLGLKDNVEDWYLIGKGGDRKKAMSEKLGFDVPTR